jgi:hypothetical protein
VFLGQAPLAAGRNARETASDDAVDHALSLHTARLS